ncbi:MAG: KdsC family phosphatase [Cyclobacteriaceae bacterium]|jgi:3-deoxy-D-manno-octulosonate 8-phosphate phosphatase (KDO 8-P phosphatase)
MNIKLLVLDVDGTLTDGGVYVTAKGDHFKRFNAKDGMGIKLAEKAGIKVGIISHSFITEMVTTRAADLGLKYVYVGQEPKMNILRGWMAELNLELENIAFIGDDVNDGEIMQFAGHSACPADAVDQIKKIADIVLTKKGGFGAVREYIDNYLLNE